MNVRRKDDRAHQPCPRQPHRAPAGRCRNVGFPVGVHDNSTKMDSAGSYCLWSRPESDQNLACRWINVWTSASHNATLCAAASFSPIARRCHQHHPGGRLDAAGAVVRVDTLPQRAHIQGTAIPDGVFAVFTLDRLGAVNFVPVSLPVLVEGCVADFLRTASKRACIDCGGALRRWIMHPFSHALTPLTCALPARAQPHRRCVASFPTSYSCPPSPSY